MKLHSFLFLATATLLPAQNPPKKPANVKAVPAAAPANVHKTLVDLQRDFQEKKFDALDAYVKTHAKASDAGDAIVEATELAKELSRPDHVLRLADLYLASLASGPAANQMRVARGEALTDKGDTAGAQKVFEELMAQAGDDVNTFVTAATALADLLVNAGKKDEGIKVLTDAGEAKASVRGLKQHLQRIADNYNLIGTDPTAMGQNDTAEKAIDLAEYKGKVLLIDFWATWCGPCVAELPNVIAAYEKHHAKGFEILGISLDEDREAFDKFIAAKKMTWRHHFDGKGWKNEIAVAYGVQSIPATYLIGPDGKIAAVGLRGNALEKRVAALLGGDKPAASKPK